MRVRIDIMRDDGTPMAQYNGDAGQQMEVDFGLGTSMQLSDDPGAERLLIGFTFKPHVYNRQKRATE